MASQTPSPTATQAGAHYQCNCANCTLQNPQLSQCTENCSYQAPIDCYNHNDLVVVEVSSASELEEDFEICRGLLTWHSAWFAARLDPHGGFCDSGDRIIKTGGDYTSIEVWRAFRCWAYTGRLFYPPHSPPQLRALIDMWIFGDYHGIPGFQNAVIDVLHETWVTEIWPRHIDASHRQVKIGKLLFFNRCVPHVYENTVEGSMLRKFCVELYVMSFELVTLFDIEKKMGDWPKDFVLEVWAAREKKEVTLGSRLNCAEKDRCRWHDHGLPGGARRTQHRG